MVKMGMDKQEQGRIELAQGMRAQGMRALRAGQSAQALVLLEQALETVVHPALRNEVGRLHLAQGNRARAEAAFRQAIAEARTLGEHSVAALGNLANLLTASGREDEALALYREALAQDPDCANTLYNFAHLLRLRRAHGEAEGLYRRCLAVSPGHYRAWFNLGACLEEMGRFAEAGRAFSRVLDLVPDHGRAMARLLNLRENGHAPGLLAQAVVQAQAHAQTLPEGHPDRPLLHGALGRHFDRRGQVEEAMHHFEAAARARAARAGPFDGPALAARVERIIARDAPASANFEAQDQAMRPIFVVGMPRAGTSLAEQILSSHRAVFGAGEILRLPVIHARYEAMETEPDAVQLAAWRADYLAHVARLDGAKESVFVDKLPFNFLHLGLARRLFPEAVIVHCTRSPRDIALSCFIEGFQWDQGDFSNRFEDIGALLAVERRIMAHWSGQMPIHTLSYEALIADPEAAVGGLLAACGLAPDPACLDFHRADRVVQTPSRWQVRQPLYASSVGRWRPYARWLGELPEV